MRLHHALRGAAGQAGGSGITSPTHSDLIAFYTMDNISGTTLVDETGNGNDGVINGATAVPGIINNALNFDGANDNVGTPIVHSTTALSVALWANPDVLGMRQDLFGDFDAGGANVDGRCSLILDIVAGKYTLITGNGVDFAQESINHGLVSGVWTFVVLNINGTSAEIFENGVSVGAVTLAISLDPTNSAGTWRLAAPGDLEDRRFNGQLDMVRRFNRDLAPSEISELYNGGIGA